MTKEELAKLTVKDVIRMDAFKVELEKQLDLEQDNQTKEVKRAATMGCRLKRTPLDSLRDKGVFNAERMADLFESVLNKSLLGFGANERQYIHNLGMLAFARVMTKLQKEAEPEEKNEE